MASVFALAIAGAVVAAPAASATAALGDAARAIPTADAAWVDATGALRTSADVGAAYSATHATSQAKVLTGTNQTANGIQIVVPQATVAGDVTVTLPAAVATFNGVPAINTTPLVQVTGTNSLDYLAGPGATGTHSTALPVVDASKVLTQSSGASLSVAPSNVLTIHLDAAPASSATGAGYVVTLTGVRVNVLSTTQGAPIVATIAGPGGLAGTTTVGYAGTLALTAAAGSVDAGATAPQAAPNLTLSETVVNGFATGAKVLNVADDGGVPATVFAAVPTATVSGSTTLTAAITGFAGATGTVTLGGTADNTAIESVALSGLKVNAIPADATKVTVSLASTGGTADNGAVKGFSFVPNYAGLSVDVPVTRPENRYAGSNRNATAAQIADAFVTQNGKVGSVILANGLDVKVGADALSANFLAGAKTAPVLLTNSSSTLPAETTASLKKILAGPAVTIYVMGKTDSVSQAARDAAVVAAYSVTGVTSVTVKEIAGPNRYATSAAAATEGSASIAPYALQTGKPFYKTAFLASGLVNADALAAGAASANLGIPVLLTSGKTLDTSVSTAINNLGIQQLIILGQTDRVSTAVETAAKDAGVLTTLRIAGANRYETAADIYSFVAGSPASAPGLGKTLDGKAYLASGGAGWPDALTVGPLAGTTADVGAVLTTSAATLAPAAASFLTANKSTVKTVWTVGGTDRVSSAVLAAAQDALK